MRWRRIGGAAVGVAGLAVIGVVGALGYASFRAETLFSFPDEPMPSLSASTDPDLIERGRYLVYGPAHCAQCHSTPERAHPEKIPTSPLSGGLAFEMGPIGGTWSANLTSDVETGIGGRTDAEIARAIRSGVLHDGSLSIFMATSIGKLSDEDLVAVLSYLRSLPPVHNPVPKAHWTLLGDAMLVYAFPELLPRREAPPVYVPAGDEPSVARGEYLAANVALCTECHRAFDMATFKPNGPPAGGGTPEPSHGEDSDMEFVAPNLTSHPTGITGKLDEDAFLERVRKGRAYASSIMPWECVGAMTESDLRSVYRYLRSLPPVDNDVGPTYRKIGWVKEEVAAR